MQFWDNISKQEFNREFSKFSVNLEIFGFGSWITSKNIFNHILQNAFSLTPNEGYQKFYKFLEYFILVPSTKLLMNTFNKVFDCFGHYSIENHIQQF